MVVFVASRLLLLLPQNRAFSDEETRPGVCARSGAHAPRVAIPICSFRPALRRVEGKTGLRAEWTAGGSVERFFDYVPKGTRPAGR